MTETFFIGDTHFYHTNILMYEAEARPFDSVDEMNETLIDNWNSVVTKDDVVYHMGDVVFGGIKNLKIVERLKGKKRLIIGNHDKLKKLPDYIEYMKYFEMLYTMRMWKHGILLTHIPIHVSQFYRFNANIHGHTHSKCLNDPRYINVSCENIGLMPISWDELEIQIYKDLVI